MTAVSDTVPPFDGAFDLPPATGSIVVIGHRAQPAPILRLRPARRRPVAVVLKRAFDIVFSLIALVVVALLTPVVALAIALDSPGPVIFRQQRVGRNGEPFRIVKFRSMRADAEAVFPAMTGNHGSGPLFKLRDDPRVTRVGRILRRSSLDELPQFWNVLRGDMSIVGPRPSMQREVDQYTPRERRRLLVKPGITGPWQVSGRSDLSWEESVRLDLGYVDGWSFGSDLRYVCRTVTVMLRPKGAY